MASVAAYLRSEFPLAPIGDLPGPERPDILIAGCGTGQQSIGAAQRFPDARVLAIDLSLTSLAYAVRKSREAGRFIGGWRTAGLLPAGPFTHLLQTPHQRRPPAPVQ